MKTITKAVMILAVGVILTNCTCNKRSNSEILISTEWQLDSVGTKSEGFILDQENIVSIVFSDSTSFTGNGGCNHYFGGFTTEEEDGDMIEIEVKGRSMAMCPNIIFEDRYISALNGVTQFVVEEDKLILNNIKDGVTLIFIPTEK